MELRLSCTNPLIWSLWWDYLNLKRWCDIETGPTIGMSASWALQLPWWPPAECSNVSMSSEYWYLQNAFLFLYDCRILSEIKLTTTMLYVGWICPSVSLACMVYHYGNDPIGGSNLFGGEELLCQQVKGWQIMLWGEGQEGNSLFKSVFFS